MFGFIKKIFKAPEIAGKIIDGGIRGLDALVFTDEEKAQLSADTYKTWLECQKVLVNESSVRSITRRIMACMVMGTFLLFLITAAGVYLWFPAFSAFLLSLAGQLSSLVLAISVFYFGVQAVRIFKDK